ncbi:hypothetical protein PhCBS80983_g05890 [Powellomyces hirtus]|uniref:Acyl-CoA dehydrogenase n=1 Tax=Powellomyces hirtus TaxID=109895 RepID=A0A507DS05_9FUNG|nr:hypothetical protein PhCBS80983_g05890 [Powellomyces hirtus]
MELPATADRGFQFRPPVLKNQYTDDLALQGILSHYLPHEHFEHVQADLSNLGHRAITDILAMGDNAEQHPPTLTQYDHWCRRIDKLETSEGWRALKGVSAIEGLVAIGYERPLGEFSRIYQFAKLYVASPSMAMFPCPLAMTDGAARCVELFGTQGMKQRALSRLISRDPAVFWTSGQWMTERPGGSDVGGTETQAVRVGEDGRWHMSGFKWFSSATDSDMTLLLARTVNPASNTSIQGSKGLSLFYSELRNADGNLDGIRVHRLKNKLGTKALPTAELELYNLPGTMVGKENRGVATISVVLNVTRIYSAMGATSNLRRAFAIAKSYAENRTVFGKLLSEQPLHSSTLAEVAMTLRGCTIFLFYAVKVLGESECAPDEERRKRAAAMLRLTTPLLKMWVCHEAVPAISEALEACGGQGYMEETGVARQLRDAQVNAIWEGTTNVQALDVLKIVQGAFGVYASTVAESVKEGGKSAKVVEQGLRRIEDVLKMVSKWDRLQREARARQIGFAMARTLIGALLVDHAVALETTNHVDAAASRVCANRWCCDVTSLVGRLDTADHGVEDDEVLVYGKPVSSAKL